MEDTNVLIIISKYASIFTAILMAMTTLILTIKSIRIWIANGLANSVKLEGLSKDSDLYKELSKNNVYEGNFLEIETSLIRLELLRYFDFHPEEKRTIYTLIDKYRKTGGNSYMCDIITEWEKGEYKSMCHRMCDMIEEKQEEKTSKINKLF